MSLTTKGRDFSDMMPHIYGQTMGKCAVRPLPDVIPCEHPHRFASRTGAPLATAQRGYLMHYNRFDSRNFIDATRQVSDHPKFWRPGGSVKVEKQKRVWSALANDSSRPDRELREYFERWIMVPDAEIRGWLTRDPPAAIVMPSDSRVFRELRADSFREGSWIRPTVTPVQ